ncbi:hypothetical protein RAJCM14343_1757 [Rhodococcus aetherivorans]|uniref:Uncharacterized protein n=1 Tax=Rhodococcus aetherivorans TaxID=191292 RepID=A0ABQ0YIX3_9NOCA|nr:hypothetical protein [Rhodococcus aetherivorans]KDE11522.1 hypothetical protein N505_0125215 [Rhodococcus aetherivorans]NGP29139.1 hypothetical protein [Rhodococcus aetherivorans]GES36505.1 hypothetical protein RAJCM14343_1757 [Rhodococcus aetherivorans]
MGTAQAAVIGRERLQLVLGDEVGVTAREVSVDGERIRLGAADLRLAARVLRENGVEPVDFDALVVVSTDHETVLPFGGGHDEVTVEILGVPDGPLAVLRTLDPRVCVAMLAEATAAAWRQRLSDAADAAGQVTSADVEAVGPIAIPGAPTLTELRSERRRLLAKEASERTPNGTDPQDSAVLDEVIADLRAAVRFGAAGLVDTPDDQLAKGLASAAAEGGWLSRLRLLLAAQEIAAIELVLASRTLGRPGADSGPLSPGEHILGRLDAERDATDDLVSILSDLRDRLPTEPASRAQRLLRRKLLEDARSVRMAVDAYLSVMQSSASVADESITWDDALEALGALDEASAHGRALAVPMSGTFDHTGDGTDVEPSLEEIASLLGEIFARQLPEARKQVDELGRRHPGEKADALIARVKRQAIADLGKSEPGGDSNPVLETVAALAMSIALLRGIEPHSGAEFAEMGRRILDRTQGIAEMRNRAGQAIPLAVAGFERVAHQMQPVLVEALFRAMAMAAPSGAGAARDFYKNTRSTVWRARHKRGIAAAAAAGAGHAVRQALNAGAARLLVREVDRALAAPKRSVSQ